MLRSIAPLRTLSLLRGLRCSQSCVRPRILGGTRLGCGPAWVTLRESRRAYHVALAIEEACPASFELRNNLAELGNHDGGSHIAQVDGISKVAVIGP